MTQANRIKNLEKVIKLLTEQIELKDQLAKRVEGYSHTFTIPKTPETFEGLHIPHVCEEPKLEVGKWYIIKRIEYDSKYVPALIYLKDKSISNYGFNHAGDWTVSYGDTGSWDNTEDIYTPATDKEISEALIKEAKKRGFKEGIKYLSPNKSFERVIKLPLKCDTDSVYDRDSNVIFLEGKWATIVERSVPTIAGYKMEDAGCMVKFGCESFDKGFLKQLYESAKHCRLSAVLLKDTEVSLNQLKEIVDYLNPK